MDHSILVAKRQALGVNGRLIRIIESFFDRRQLAQTDDAKSSERKVTGGVPKGSRSGPIFLLVYINNHPEAINDLLVSAFLVADDSKILDSGASFRTWRIGQ